MTATEVRLGGRPATTGVIPGRYSLSVGKPSRMPPRGWRWELLTDLARLETGHTPSRSHPEYWGGDVPWIGIRDATENHGRTILDTKQHTNELGIANSAARVLPAETVCLSRTASVGYVVVMGRPMATSQDFVNWVCGERLDYQFLKYVLVAEGPDLLQFAHGTTHQTIYFPEVKAFHVCLPPIEEQRRIADILDRIDQKIELNRRMNETLETIARTIFKSWFVDFDPVRAKIEGRQPAGMSAETAALFPEELVTSDLEPIPSKWTVTPVGEAVRIVGGSTPSTKEPAYWGGPHFFATPKDLSELDSILLLSTERTITDGGVERISSGILPRGTVLLSSRAPIGYVAIARMPVSINQGFIGMVCDRDLPTSYVALWAKSNVEVFKQNAGGTTFAEISKAVFRPLPILVPPPSILERFTACVDPLFDRIEANLRESETLSEIRDALLPRLVSGEVRVKAAS